MRILLANYRYFISGGPERYMFNVADALATRGHQVVPFSVRYVRNQPTPYEEYFVEPSGSPDEVYFRDRHFTPRTLWRTLQRLFYAPDVERSVLRIVHDTQPQIAYVLHYLRHLSPSLLVGLKRANLPVVVRLSDYAMLCPQVHCLRNGQPCDLCTRGNLWRSVSYRCVQNSWLASASNALSTWYHRFRHYFDLIDVFVVTNLFMYRMMSSAGFPERRLRHIPTFVDGNIFQPRSDLVKNNTVVYAGRLEAIKGVHVLLGAWALLRCQRPDLDLRLKLVGMGDPDYCTRLKNEVRSVGLQDCVEFTGEVETPELVRLLGQALVTVVPSLCYENSPNAILESYACGTPVLASNLGSLSGCVQDGQTGYLFQPADATDLAARLEYCLDHPQQVFGMACQARQVAEDLYSPAKHLESLEALFTELT